MSVHTRDASPVLSGLVLHVHMLGAADIRTAKGTLALNDQKARALIFYLAATGHPHTRDHLAALLWSESSDTNARHSLRSCLHHLRQSLLASGTAEILVTSRNQVQLHLPDQHACDVAQFQRLLADGSDQALTQAVALYRGPLLAGFTLTDAPVFEHWLRAEAAALSQSYHNTLLRLADRAEAHSNWGAAIEFLQRIVHSDPLDEAVQRRLIALHLQYGAPGRALHQYQQFATELQRELHLNPSAETRELVAHALQPQQEELAPSASQQDSSKLARSTREHALPLVGRRALLEQLLALAQEPLSGRGCTLLLHGEAGMGKTRLRDELEAQLAASSQSWIVLHGACSPYDDLLSYAPFYDALQSAASGDLTDMLTTGQPPAPAEARNIGWRVLRALRLLAQSGPVLLAIDDLHWANSATLHLFGFLATRIQALPVLLIGTVQHPEAIPAIQRLLAVGRAHGQVHLLPLAPLNLAAITELLFTLGLSADAATSLAEWLLEQSAGSPFILGEILAQLSADATLTREGARLHLDAPRWLRRRIAYTLPDTTYDLVSWRLSSLPPESLHLLDILAVAGQPLPFALIRDLSGVRPDDSLQLVDDLLARGLLVETPGETIALPHHLLREALLTRLSQLRRRILHRQLLGMVEKCPVLEAHFRVHQVALHAVAGEDVERARRYGLQVLDELLRDEPSAETLGFLHELHDLLAPTALATELIRLALALAKAHQALGQLEAAAHWNQRRREIAQASGDLLAEAEACFDSGELALVSNDYLAAVSAAKAGLDICAQSEERSSLADWDQLAGRGYRLLGAAQAMEGSDLITAEENLRRAALCHRQIERVSDLCADLFELGNVAAQRGELARALEYYQEAGHAAETGHVSYFLALAHNNFAYHSLLLGDVQAARQAALQGQRVAESHALVGALLHLSSTQGEIQLYLAEWEAAATFFRHGLALADDLGNQERQAGYRAGLALVARGQGNLKQATALLEAARDIITEQEYRHLRVRILLSLADIWRLRGRIEKARLCLQDALTIAQHQGRALLLMQGQRLRAQLLATSGDWEEATALFGETRQRAIRLHLVLEDARTLVAFGTAMLQRPSDQREGERLLREAIATFTHYDARADLQQALAALRLARR